MNSSNGNMAEYTVERKATGKYLKYKIACLALYAAIVLAYFCTTVALSSYGVWVAIVIIPFVPLFIGVNLIQIHKIGLFFFDKTQSAVG